LRGKTFFPEAYSLAVGAGFGGDGGLGPAGGGGKNDPAAQGDLLGRAHGRQPVLDLRLLLFGYP